MQPAGRDRTKERPLFCPGLADDPSGGAMATRQNDLLAPLACESIVVTKGGSGRKDLSGEPGEEALFHLPHHAFDLPFGLGTIRPTGPRDRPQHGAEVNPFRCEDCSAITGLANAEH